MLDLTCTGCKQKVNVSEEADEIDIKCPACGQIVHVSSLAAVRTAAHYPRQPAPARPAGRQPTPGPLAPTKAMSSAPDLDTLGGDFGPDAAQETQDVLGFLAPAEAAGELGRLGCYRVIRILGVGGMGVVFLAEDLHLERHLALKVLKPALAASTPARKRFLREAKAAAGIKHDHIVTIFQVGEDRGAPYLAMELLEGESLEDRIRRESVLPLAEVLRIGRETAEGLEAAHRIGLIHRDIKPDNLWLETRRSGSRVKILDFGLARALDDTKLTKTGAIIGTPAYMAPEQARGEPVDHRCDLFSLGCVLYQMCTGILPFKGKNTMSILLALATDIPQAPVELNADLPPALVELIMSLLAKNRQDRPESARAVVQALESIEKGETAAVPGSRSDGIEARKPPGRTDHREIPRTLALVALLGIFLAGALFIFFLPGRSVNEAWLRKVASLKPEEQVTEVVSLLKELNPGFDGAAHHQVEDGVIIQLKIATDKIADIAPLRALTGLKKLSCGSASGKSPLSTLAPLRDLKLTALSCAGTSLYDLAPLHAMKLADLDCAGTAVYDLSPLQGMKLVSLNCSGTKIYDLTPLKGMMLESLNCAGTKVFKLSPLRDMKLQSLNCRGTQVVELWPLEEMKLTLLDCGNTQVSDLSALKNTKLISLYCDNTQVSDLTPLSALPLKELRCDPRTARAADSLRSIKTLTTINEQTAAEFWASAPK